MSIQSINGNKINSSIRLQLANNIQAQTAMPASQKINTPAISNDTFEKTNKKHLSTSAKAGIALCAIAIGVGAILTFKSKPQPIAEGFREKLAKGLSDHLGKKVEANSLSCVLNKDEFIEVISKLEKNNYILSPENVEKGIFRADLHSHSNFSDGLGDVSKLLDEAAEYGDKLYEKTQSKFTFALTDHDGVDGVIEALKHISENPQKFKNVNFVPGAELSYAHISPKSANPTETSEVLAYCIDPFNKKIQSYFSNLHLKRSSAIKGTIDELNKIFPDTNFSADEFSKIYGIDLNKDMYKMNLHWQIHHYGQTKLAVSNMAKEQGKNAEELYSEIMSKTGKFKALGNLKDKGLVPPEINENGEIIKLKEKIQPQITSDGLVNAQTESTIEEIISTFADDKETVFALAHPYYLTERVENPIEFIKPIIDKFKEKLIGTESYHQAYGDWVPKDKLNEINSGLEALNLKPLGGRDNHLAKLL